MKFKVRYFAAFREATGTADETLDSQASTPSALFEECQRRHAGLENYSASLVAVNDEMAGWQAPLNDGDEVLFFPPVAGG
jgi:molybdopterin converting factor subunit 1